MKSYFPDFSQVSENMVIACIKSLILDHMMVSMGTFVLSWDGLSTPSALSFMVATMVANLSGDGIGPFNPSFAEFGSPCGSVPKRTFMAMAPRAVTKLLASFSTASPVLFSGAPVTESVVASIPALGLVTPPLKLPTKAIGAGGNRRARTAGETMSAINKTRMNRVKKSRAHMAK